MVKPAVEVAKDLETWIPKAKKAIVLAEDLRQRLETDEEFQKLWETDSAEALRRVGIDPDARKEVGLPPYDQGPECTNCITPMGNYCHC
jgi:hypothetical protein